MNILKNSIYERQLRIFSLCNALCNRDKKTREFGRRKERGRNKGSVLTFNYINEFRIKENLPENTPELLKIRVSLVRFLVSAPLIVFSGFGLLIKEPIQLNKLAGFSVSSSINIIILSCLNAYPVLEYAFQRKHDPCFIRCRMYSC